MGVTRIGNITGLDRIGIPVATAIRPNSRSVAVSLGKGPTLEAAMVAALMEAAENFHGEALAHRFRDARYVELGARAADPARLPRTGTAFDRAAVIPWIEGLDLAMGTPCWVPAELVHTDATLPLPRWAGHFLVSSNGLGAGNTRAEAIAAGLAEVIERDAMALWRALSLAERSRTALDLATIDDSDCRVLLDRIAQAGFAARLWAITSDIGIPAFACDLRAGPGEPLRRRFRGACCHPDAHAALAGAIAEAVQTRLAAISGTRDDLPPKDYAEPRSAPFSEALLDALAAEIPPASLDVPDPPDSPEAAVARMRDGLDRAGCGRVIVVDLTRPEIGIAVVRVIVEGLEPPSDHPLACPGERASRSR